MGFGSKNDRWAAKDYKFRVKDLIDAGIAVPDGCEGWDVQEWHIWANRTLTDEDQALLWDGNGQSRWVGMSSGEGKVRVE